ncbi:MAG TPA: UxaA family hydrolase [Desulfomonilaceae bacterium]|nr:UxaA family hydrolase [Desulfomonilaceae bacterium]HVN78632.1 UxaA family hydrolase [Terriglobia bacterium]
MAKARVIVINGKDNVATALESLRRGVEIAVEIQDNVEKVTLVSDIPPGHKFALRDIKKGDSVIKYGEPIGQSLAKIVRGEHVHVHNVTSKPRLRRKQ